MKILVRLSLILLGPYLVLVYWRNTMRELGDVHARFELNYE